MRTKIVDLQLGEQTFRLRWDFNAIATFEDLTGLNALDGIPVTARTVLALLWAAVDADAASRDEEAPVSYRQFGSLMDSVEMQARAMEAAEQFLRANMPEQAPQEGAKKADPPKAAQPNRSQRRAATRSARSTSASPSANSGA